MGLDRPKLLQPLPDNRSYEDVLRHYELERAIAKRLMAADREERKRIYGTMYSELFAQVPDHPRLTRRSDKESTRIANLWKMALVKPFLQPGGTFLEFGPGDCRFAFEVAKIAAHVLAVDISDQADPRVDKPENFRIILYDGYHLDLQEDFIDTAFSDQLIEHLHPDDTEHHFRIAYRVLKVGGVYVFRTPHRLTGPHDVSRYFSERPEGFHLKEWTYGELATMAKNVGFRMIKSYWVARGHRIQLPIATFRMLEALLGRLPLAWRRSRLRYLLPGISMTVRK